MNQCLRCIATIQTLLHISYILFLYITIDDIIKPPPEYEQYIRFINMLT